MTEEEKRIGSNMAYLNGGAILVNFIIIALLIGPGTTGYNETYGVFTDILQLVAGFSAACLVVVNGKVWDWENNFYFGMMTRIVFVIACVQMLYGVAATANANSVFDTTFNADQVLAMGGATQWFQFVGFGIYALTLLSVDNGKLPGWGRSSGYGFVILVLGAQVASLFGLIPEALFVPIFVLGGVVLYPIFVFGVGSAISKS
jgi:hypothetical protein